MKRYYVQLSRWRDYPDGGGTNFECCKTLGRARHLAKKLKRDVRQIDVHITRCPNPKVFVFEGSWL